MQPFYPVLRRLRLVFLAPLFLSWLLAAQPEISGLTDNRADYPEGKIPKYEKFEATFSLETSALNPYWPYDGSAPAGIPNGAGVTVNGLFTPDEWETIYLVPGFFYQEFEENPQLSEWLYPKDQFFWKVRFSPHFAGSWQFRITVRDSSGFRESPAFEFQVIDSDRNGFVRVSRNDPRYFEFSGGRYFPSLGHNLNARQVDWINPASNEETFKTLHANGLQLVRTWISQWSIFGSAWGKWFSHNRAHRTQEPQMGLIHELDENLVSNYPDVSPPAAPGDVFMWLNHDETVFADGNQWNFTPCRVLGWESARVPLKRNRTYRVRVRYRVEGLKGPRTAGKPFGFVVKEGGWMWPESETGRCDDPDAGTVLAATYQRSGADPWSSAPDPAFPGWHILEGWFESGERDFLNFLYLALENVHSPQGGSAGHAFIDHVWIQEDLGDGLFGSNAIQKPSMDHHYYINQRDALALDQVLRLASKYDVYLKPVVLEKNDYIFNILDFEGGKSPSRQSVLFFGNGRETSGKTKVRWLHESWWRYLQARWGYSPHIHSWELLNEGPPAPVDGPHWVLADEFGKFMKCGVFGIEAAGKCVPEHPNAHLVTTSFWGGFPSQFWNNVSGEYPNLDYADVHEYVHEGQPGFGDAALATQSLSATLAGQFLEGARMPIVRGEVAWTFAGEDLFKKNVSGGVWLHNFVWAGINPGGLIEHYWASPPGDGHIWDANRDHRSVYRAFYEFIKDVPLSNGNYRDAKATSDSSDLRVLGQVDPVRNRAHLWIQNKHHTWSVLRDNLEIPLVNALVIVPGMAPSQPFWLQLWDTASGIPYKLEPAESDEAGNIQFPVSSLRSDVAVQIFPAGIRPLEPPTLRRLELQP